MAIAEAELEGLKGETVKTPDGNGKVLSVGARYVTVKLEDGQMRQFEPRELNEVESKKGKKS